MLCLLMFLCSPYFMSRTSSAKINEDTAKLLFDRLLEENEVELASEEYQDRFGFFLVKYIAFMSANGTGLVSKMSLDDMYSGEELDLMNGAHLEKEPPTPVLRSKREVFDNVPSSYDVREHVVVSKPKFQGMCGNCYIHTFLSALEIGYSKLTGKHLEFSAQELTDCFYRGCRGGDYRMVANMVAVTDRLSAWSGYGPYLSQHVYKSFTCRSAVAPDNLLDIKVTGYRKVTPDNLDYYVYKYGAVMACMSWQSTSSKCGPGLPLTLRKVSDVFHGKTIPGGCDHAVTIVGYTSEYYIVKNSHGVSWGDGGYFKIVRGTNACGIEDNMAVIITEVREGKKQLSKDNCPLDKPHYCSTSKSCTAKDFCVYPEDQKKEQKRDTCVDISRFCRTLKSRCDKATTQQICKKTCNACGGVRVAVIPSTLDVECRDRDRYCASMSKDFCDLYPSVKHTCPNLCDSCQMNEEVTPAEKEKRGKCTKPRIEHGHVVNPRDMLSPGEELRVSCDPGYRLVGETVRCIIQDVYGPDSRLLPACVKISEAFEGYGEEYSGSKDTTVLGNKCLSWDKVVLSGNLLMSPSDAQKFVLGNHNLCRNVFKSPNELPSCWVEESSSPLLKREFCFSFPMCSACNGKNILSQCNVPATLGECEFKDADEARNVKYNWKYCNKACCTAAKCA